jgi:serine/threonine protein kinase
MDRPLLPALPGYDDLELIAHGTTALVFRGIQTTLKRPVAIKVITMDTGDLPVNADRELATTVALSSQPHIVSIIDTGLTDDDRPYIVMEYCEGGSYNQILRREGPLPIADVIEVGITIGEALHAAHQAGIVHRDVKPSNILRSRFGPALTDFGIARAPDELGTTLTREMMTPHHASPEALLHQAQSGSSDVYSLASTMWTLLVGHPPFVDPARPGLDMYAFRDRVLNESLPGMSREDVPEWLVGELNRAMSKLPSQRHATAREFADALRRATLLSAGTHIGRPPVPPSIPPPAPARTPSPRDPEPVAAANPVIVGAQRIPTQQPPPPPPPPSAPAAVPAPMDPAPWDPPLRSDPPSADVMEDEGGWLGPVAQGDLLVAPPPAEVGPPTRRFDDEVFVAPPSRRRFVVALLVAVAVIAVASAAVLALNAGRGATPIAQPTDPSSTTFITARGEGAPRDVKVAEDHGNSVRLEWTDPTASTVSFIVVGKGPAAERLAPQSLPRGTTTVTFTGLDPTKNYCFTVGAVYTYEQVATAPDVCTSR